MAGIKEIAERAGVSMATVSNVLNNRRNVGKETRERILSIAKELNYRPREEQDAAKKKNTILVNFSDFGSMFYMDILRGINDFVEQRHYHLLICSGNDLKRYAEEETVCGCIVIDQKTEDAVVRSVADRGLPLITLDRELDHKNIKSVLVNNYDAERQLVEKLIESGYRSFAYLKGPDTEDSRDRYRAFKDVLKENGISIRRTDVYEGDWREQSGAQAARIIMLQETLPQVMVCANDMMAIGAIRKFQENGIRTPEDISVCGFDDIIIAKYLGLTTVGVPDYERGYLAGQALVNIIDGTEDCESLRIGARLKWRKTTGLFYKKTVK